jgi:hypothetical protein
MTARLLAVTVVLSSAATLSAQGYKYLNSVATFKVAPGKEAAFVDKGKAFIPVLDKLLDSGLILGYGIDVDMLHVPGENNITFWTEPTNYDTLAKSEDAIEAFIKSNSALMQDLTSMADMTTHHDFILRTWEHSHKGAPVGAQPVEDIDSVRVKPGRGHDFLTMFRNFDKPVYEKLVADGVIYAYELDSEAVHTMEPGLVWVIVTMPDLGAKDKVNAAFDAAEKALPEGERDIMDKEYEDLTVPGSHRDSLSTSVVFRVK